MKMTLSLWKKYNIHALVIFTLSLSETQKVKKIKMLYYQRAWMFTYKISIYLHIQIKQVF